MGIYWTETKSEYIERLEDEIKQLRNRAPFKELLIENSNLRRDFNMLKKYYEALIHLDTAAKYTLQYGDGLLSSSFVQETVKKALLGESNE